MAVALTEAVLLPVGDAVMDAVKDAVPVPLEVAPGVREEVAEAVMEPVSEALAVSELLPVPDEDAVAEEDAVLLGGSEALGVWVRLAERVGVARGEELGLAASIVRSTGGSAMERHLQPVLGCTFK